MVVVNYFSDLGFGQLSFHNQAALSLSAAVVVSLLSVYSASGHMVDASELMYGIHIGILLHLMHIKKFMHVVYMWLLSGIFVPGTYIAIA